MADKQDQKKNDGRRKDKDNKAMREAFAHGSASMEKNVRKSAGSPPQTGAGTEHERSQNRSTR